MKVQEKVLRVWKRLSLRERRILRTQGRQASCAAMPL